MTTLGSAQNTEGIQIRVEPQYVPSESRPGQSYWLFTYEVTISNDESDTAQLLSRHWIITDANGIEEHVQGPGVVGETPTLKTGQSFSYTSFCPLSTSMGTMHGSFRFRRSDGTEFDAQIAPFVLAVPGTLN